MIHKLIQLGKTIVTDARSTFSPSKTKVQDKEYISVLMSGKIVPMVGLTLTAGKH